MRLYFAGLTLIKNAEMKCISFDSLVGSAQITSQSTSRSGKRLGKRATMSGAVVVHWAQGSERSVITSLKDSNSTTVEVADIFKIRLAQR